jgi:hypothetical protein
MLGSTGLAKAAGAIEADGLMHGAPLRVSLHENMLFRSWNSGD